MIDIRKLKLWKKNRKTGAVPGLALFSVPLFVLPGTAYGAAELRALVGPAVLIHILLLALVIYLWRSRGHRERQAREKLAGQLEMQSSVYRTLFDEAPLGIAVMGPEGHPLEVNRRFGEITGYTPPEILSMSWEEYTHPEDIEEDRQQMKRMLSGEITGYQMDKRYLKPDGTPVWIRLHVASLQEAGGRDTSYMSMIEDLSDLMGSRQALEESERSKSMLLSNLPGLAYRCRYDRDWTMEFVSEGCLELTGWSAEDLLHNRRLTFNDLIHSQWRDRLREQWDQVLKDRRIFRGEYPIITRKGESRWVYEQGQGIFDSEGRVLALEGMIIDISDRKKMEDEIRYMSDHDSLTGLYNFRYAERAWKEMEKPELYPLSVISVDINGLKLINDAFGHAQGDILIRDTAGILRSVLRQGDVLARTGGDEFQFLMPRTGRREAQQRMEAIREACGEYNRRRLHDALQVSVSMGLAVRTEGGSSLEEVIRLAEDRMYKEKLLDHKSSHSTILTSIRATMFARSQETEEHAARMAQNSRELGRALGLTPGELNDLELLATLHDLGKVGIDDRILNKPGPLTPEEWVEMKRHPEIGFRIAMSSPDLAPIAQYILSHHERWDGSGYPRGLAGQEIPLLSRILAVADAFDAMTTDRIYRPALGLTEAVEELRRGAGTQFDPHLVRLFLEEVLMVNGEEIQP